VVDEHARAGTYSGGEVAQRYGDQAALEQVIGCATNDPLAALVVDRSRHGPVRYLVTALRQRKESVDWANGWEGGRVVGRDAVRDYWQRQWAEIDSTAEPTAVTERPDGTVEVTVHLLARDKEGNVLNDAEGRHVYEFRGDLVERMTIEE
jgi:hypothetical protein